MRTGRIGAWASLIGLPRFKPEAKLHGRYVISRTLRRVRGLETERLYMLTVHCTDASGDSATQPVTVTVSHDQGR